MRVDDHRNPSIYLRPDGRLSFFYSDHQGPKSNIRTTKYPRSLKSISGPRDAVHQHVGPPRLLLSEPVARQ